MNGAPMFERQYDIEGSTEKIFLKIFEPQPDDRGWKCTYALEAPFLKWSAKMNWYSCDDKLGALAGVFTKITIELRSLARRSGSYVTFNGDKNLDLIDRDFY